MRTPSLARLLRNGFLISLLVGTLLRAEDIRIRVLNARNGKPITNECLNVSLGSWHGADLLVPTNREGTAVLHIGSDVVTADAVSPQACGGKAIVGPKPLPKDSDAISITSDYYVACQEYGRLAAGQPATPNSLKEMVPSYSIKRVIELGVSASNTCGKFRHEAHPGELIFFVRPLKFSERMRQ